MPVTAMAPSSAENGIPCAQQLAALGTVLCLYRPQQGSKFSGWAQAVRVESRVGMDSDGLRESLAFFDSEDRCCWRLYLLPDSDFLAWDRMVDSLPAADEPYTANGIGERLWRRLAGRLFDGQWQACVTKLHVLPALELAPVLAASLAPLSPLGIATALRIAQVEGADENIRLEACCCAHSAFSSFRPLRSHEPEGERALPLVRFKPRDNIA